MAWPTTPVSTVNVDASSDRISLARADIKDSFDKLNDIIDHGPNLSDLDDVNIPSPSVDQVLTYTGTVWEAADATGGEVIDDLTPQLGGDLDTNARVIFDSTRNFVYVSDNIIARGTLESRHFSDGGGAQGKLQMGMTSTTNATITSTTTATGGLTVQSQAGNLVLDGEQDTYLRSQSGDIYNEVNGTGKIYYRGPFFCRNVDDLTYVGGTGQFNVTGPASSFLIQSDLNLLQGITINAVAGDITLNVPVGGKVNLENITLNQNTGAPSNSGTPTGFLQVVINGTTRYMPYYT